MPAPAARALTRSVAASRIARYSMRAVCGCSLLLLLQVPQVPAATLEGRVVHVADGDTLTVLDDEHRQHKIRLSGIDAPERGQAFGGRATEQLVHLAKNRRVTVEWHRTDRYRRLIGVVRVAAPDCAICKPDIDVGLALVSGGYAWHYRAYEREQTAQDRQSYRLAESAARAGSAGLWMDEAPTPPWDWRRSGKKIPSRL